MVLWCSAQGNMFKLSYLMLQKIFLLEAWRARAPVPRLAGDATACMCVVPRSKMNNVLLHANV
jgi:hypothetical protein